MTEHRDTIEAYEKLAAEIGTTRRTSRSPGCCPGPA